MNDTMTIRRSCEEGMYLLREGDCLWRVNEDGIKTQPRRLFRHYPLQDPSNP
jgi:hypothetical protein